MLHASTRAFHEKDRFGIAPLRSHVRKDRTMLTFTKCTVAIFVDRATGQWVVRDPDGNFWIVTTDEDAWERREPFCLAEESELESIPGHYKYLFHLPF